MTAEVSSETNCDPATAGVSGRKKWIAAAIILLLTGTILALFYKGINPQDLLVSALQWIEELGFWAPAMFVAIYILACILFIPGSILTLGAGVLFGVLKGSICVSIASTLGATACFLIGRYLARNAIAERTAGNASFNAIDKAVAKEGWKVVGLTRLSPVFPFNLLNYGYGLTRVSLRNYFFASWIGMMPGTVMYVYLGSLAGDLATLGADTERAKTGGELAIQVIGLVATVIVTIYVTRLAKTALAEKVQDEDGV